MTELAIRRLGRTEMRLKALALGCAHMGRPDRTDRDAIEAVRRAIELGINFVDTSPGYGESERRVGLALAGGWREKIALQTKIGTHPERRGDYSAEATRWSVQNSLRQLQTDTLDSVLIHDPRDIEDPLAPGRCLDTLLQLQAEGVIGHIGLGCRSHAFHRRAIATGRIETVLTYLDYTLLSQSAAQTTLPLAREHGVGVQLASVLGMGRLSGREPDPDTREHAMWQWCRERGTDVRHLALQFALAAPIDGVVVVAAGTRAHVDQVYAEALTPVSPEIWTGFKAEFGVGL